MSSRTRRLRVGIAWCKPEDYDELLRIFQYPKTMPPTYDKWLARVEELFSQLERTGQPVEKVYIDPHYFPTWCERRGLAVDANARHEYIHEFLDTMNELT